MDAIMFMFTLLFFGMGCVEAFDQDRAWRWHERSARYKGLSADSLERTVEWEVSTALLGLIAMGIGMLGMAAAFLTP
jgi:hypothetical protein